jgi:hypothetical protein
MPSTKLNDDLKRYEILVTIWKRWDESYWTSFNIFVVVTGLLLAGFTQLGKNDDILKQIFCFAGITISILWLLTLNRKFVHLTCCEEEGRKLEKEIYKNTDKKFGVYTSIKKFAHPESEEDNKYKKEIQNILGFKKYLTGFSTGALMACVFPIVILIVWIILSMLVSLIYWLFLFLPIILILYLIKTEKT